MKKILNIVVTGMFISFIIPGCQTPEKKVETKSENLNQIKNDLNKRTVDSTNGPQSLKVDWEKQITEVDKDIEKLKEEEYQSLKADWEKEIAWIEKEIKKLKEENTDKNISVDNQPPSVHKDYKSKINDLQKQSDLLRTKINNYQYSISYPEWNEFKEGFNHDLQNLSTGITDLKNKINKNID